MNPAPKRGPMWRCSKCGHMNDPGNAYCSNGCRQDGGRVRGPLAPGRPYTPPKKKRGKP